MEQLLDILNRRVSAISLDTLKQTYTNAGHRRQLLLSETQLLASFTYSLP